MKRLAIGLGLALALCADGALAQPVKVKTEAGVVAGEATERANVFRNIPFAAAPVADLRWAPPQRARAWAGERDATKNGPSCPQPMNANDTPNGGGANGPISEDCLQLNVFAPKAAKAAPVMVWIHGGGHRTGAGWVYDGQNFARDGVVVVTVNYRLGALGYFGHPALTKAAGPKAPLVNYGLMDQIAALQWVQRNIARFGGDPKNVTVFGESAGGMSTLALLGTPSAKGLYQKAIVESGLGWFEPVGLADKEKEGAAALQSIGVAPTATVAELRAIPVEKLVPLNANYRPIADGRLLTETATQALGAGRFADVPLIIGWNSGEDSLMSAPNPTPEARDAFVDRVFGGPARWVAAKASGGKPAWLYHFSYIGGRFRPAMTRATHAAEIQYVFEYWGRRTPMSVVTDEDKAMASLMHACWVAFAKAGVPTCGSEAWPAYTPAGDQLMEFGSASGVRADFRKAQLDAAQAAVLPTLGLGK